MPAERTALAGRPTAAAAPAAATPSVATPAAVVPAAVTPAAAAALAAAAPAAASPAVATPAAATPAVTALAAVTPAAATPAAAAPAAAVPLVAAMAAASAPGRNGATPMGHDGDMERRTSCSGGAGTPSRKVCSATGCVLHTREPPLFGTYSSERFSGEAFAGTSHRYPPFCNHHPLKAGSIAWRKVGTLSTAYPPGGPARKGSCRSFAPPQSTELCSARHGCAKMCVLHHNFRAPPPSPTSLRGPHRGTG